MDNFFVLLIGLVFVFYALLFWVNQSARKNYAAYLKKSSDFLNETRAINQEIISINRENNIIVKEQLEVLRDVKVALSNLTPAPHNRKN